MATISSPEAVAVGRRIEVFRVHFMTRVMRFVEEETQARKFFVKIKRALADVLPVPACENSLDVASMAFGIQNMSGRRSGLKEMARVLNLGGKMLALAMVFPDNLKFRRSLTRQVSIAISVPGAITSDIRPCYRYLLDFIQEVLHPNDLVVLSENAGLQSVKAFLLPD